MYDAEKSESSSMPPAAQVIRVANAKWAVTSRNPTELADNITLANKNVKFADTAVAIQFT